MDKVKKMLKRNRMIGEDKEDYIHRKKMKGDFFVKKKELWEEFLKIGFKGKEKWVDFLIGKIIKLTQSEKKNGRK